MSSKNKDKGKPKVYPVPKKAKERLERLLRETQMAQSKLTEAVELCRDLMGLEDDYQLKVPEWAFEKTKAKEDDNA